VSIGRVILTGVGVAWLAVTLACLLEAARFAEAEQPLGAACDAALALLSLVMVLLCWSMAWRAFK
jgi:hypothetical protein